MGHTFNRATRRANPGGGQRNPSRAFLRYPGWHGAVGLWRTNGQCDPLAGLRVGHGVCCQRLSRAGHVRHPTGPRGRFDRHKSHCLGSASFHPVYPFTAVAPGKGLFLQCKPGPALLLQCARWQSQLCGRTDQRPLRGLRFAGRCWGSNLCDRSKREYGYHFAGPQTECRAGQPTRGRRGCLTGHRWR